MPQIGVTFPGLFYLPDYLFAVLPFSAALAMLMLLHQTLAAAGMYLFLRGNSLSVWAATAGGASYALSGYMFGLSSNHSLVAGCAWLPMCLWCVQQLSRHQHRWRYCLAGALSVAMLILSGRPEIVVPALFVIVGYILLLLIEKDAEKNAIKWQLGAVLLGLALSMPMILPVAEWLSMSRRANGLLPIEVFLYSANWYDFFSMICGPALGDLKQHDAIFRALVSQTHDNHPPFIACPYLGATATTLAIWGLFSCPRKKLFFFLLILVCGSIACLGDSTAIMPCLASVVPAVSFVRFPVKLLFLPLLSLSVLAAYGLNNWQENRYGLLTSLLVWITATIGSAAILICYLLQIQCIQFFDVGSKYAALLAEYQIGTAALVSSVLAAILSAACFAVRKLELAKRFAPATLVALLIVNLLVYAFHFERMSAEPSYFTKDSETAKALKSLGSDRNTRVLNLCLERKTIPAHLPGISGADSTTYEYQYYRQILLPNTNIDFNIRSSTGFEGTMKGDYYYALLNAYVNSSQAIKPQTDSVSDEPLWRFCQLTATQFVITQINRTVAPNKVQVEAFLKPTRFKLRVENSEFNFRIYEVLGYHPRCVLSSAWSIADSHNQVLNALLRTDPGYDPVANPFVEAKSPLKETPAPTNAALNLRADLLDHSAEQVEISTNCDVNTLLVLADQSYPGWIADVDGVTTPIHLANGFMRAVEVPAGKHAVHFRYEPTSLKLGFAIFVLATGVLAYLGMVDKNAITKNV